MKQGKVWGETVCLFRTPLVELHRIQVRPHGFCSQHRHQHKWNGFFVERGELVVKMWQPSGTLDETRLGPGDCMTVEAGVVHQFIALEQGCVAFELYSVAPLAEDIIRESVGGA